MIPQFTTKEELSDFIENEMSGDKSRFMKLRKSSIKHADAVSFNYSAPNRDEAVKELGASEDVNPTELRVKVVINTTNILDSHGDVHIPGLWNKSLKENKSLLHLQEHKQAFDMLISDEVTASAKMFTWKSLGYNYEGSTQALLFESVIKAEDNPYMFDKYRKGKVKNHSVGMYYVKELFAYNSTDKYWAEEKEVYDTYIDQIVNKELAEEKGFFFVVKEAKAIEGSAVLIGSNRATPTISVVENKEAVKDTSEIIEPPIGTQKSYLDIAQTILLTQKNIKK
jgi:hypothetical protein